MRGKILKIKLNPNPNSSGHGVVALTLLFLFGGIVVISLSGFIGKKIDDEFKKLKEKNEKNP